MCPAALVIVEAVEGIFVEGQVNPALADVQVSLTADDLNLDAKTDANGKYRSALRFTHVICIDVRITSSRTLEIDSVPSHCSVRKRVPQLCLVTDMIEANFATPTQKIGKLARD